MMNKWLSWAMRSRIEPIKAVAKTIRRYRDGILAWFDSGIANGPIEGINSLIQAAKAKARGYRNKETFKAMTYLIAGKLTSDYPLETAESHISPTGGLPITYAINMMLVRFNKSFRDCGQELVWRP